MSVIRGLITGVVIVALQLLAGHGRIETERFTQSGNPTLALAVPSILIPLSIVWGWTWVSDRWSGRSGPRLALYTLALVITTAAAFPLEQYLFPPNGGQLSTAALADHAIAGVLFVLPVVAIAALLYWAFSSWLPLNVVTLSLGYLVGLPLALMLPTITMGMVAGTAAGHAWRRPGARTLIATLVILIMLIAIFELPPAAATAEAKALFP